MLTRHRLVALGVFVQFPAEAVVSCLFRRVQTDCGSTKCPIQWIPEDLSPRVKRPGFESHVSPV
jgi:hypothetical protein